MKTYTATEVLVILDWILNEQDANMESEKFNYAAWIREKIQWQMARVVKDSQTMPALKDFAALEQYICGVEDFRELARSVCRLEPGHIGCHKEGDFWWE